MFSIPFFCLLTFCWLVLPAFCLFDICWCVLYSLTFCRLALGDIFIFSLPGLAYFSPFSLARWSISTYPSKQWTRTVLGPPRPPASSTLASTWRRRWSWATGPPPPSASAKTTRSWRPWAGPSSALQLVIHRNRSDIFHPYSLRSSLYDYFCILCPFISHSSHMSMLYLWYILNPLYNGSRASKGFIIQCWLSARVSVFSFSFLLSFTFSVCGQAVWSHILFTKWIMWDVD